MTKQETTAKAEELYLYIEQDWLDVFTAALKDAHMSVYDYADTPFETCPESVQVAWNLRDAAADELVAMAVAEGFDTDAYDEAAELLGVDC